MEAKAEEREAKAEGRNTALIKMFCDETRTANEGILQMLAAMK